MRNRDSNPTPDSRIQGTSEGKGSLIRSLTLTPFGFCLGNMLNATTCTKPTGQRPAECHTVQQLKQRILCSLPGATECNGFAPVVHPVGFSRVRVKGKLHDW